MDLRNLKKNLHDKSDQAISDHKSEFNNLSNLTMSHLSSLPNNPFSQLSAVNVSQLLGKFIY